MQKKDWHSIWSSNLRRGEWYESRFKVVRQSGNI